MTLSEMEHVIWHLSKWRWLMLQLALARNYIEVRVAPDRAISRAVREVQAMARRSKQHLVGKLDQ